jgi:hypothetical protein
MLADLAIQALGPSSRRSIVAARKDMPHMGLVRKWLSVSISHTSTTQLSKTVSIVGLSLTAESAAYVLLFSPTSPVSFCD